MHPDFHPVGDQIGTAVLLHPHPDYGGDRHHPFVDGLYRRLPGERVSTLRFDFTTGDMTEARRETLEAVGAVDAHRPGAPVVLVGYSFGAAVAAGVNDPRIAGWYLLAPPASMLVGATIGTSPGPKSIQVPERDQYSTPAAVSAAVADWADTTVAVVAGVDHFLGTVGPLVDSAARWVVNVFSA